MHRTNPVRTDQLGIARDASILGRDAIEIPKACSQDGLDQLEVLKLEMRLATQQPRIGTLVERHVDLRRL